MVSPSGLCWSLCKSISQEHPPRRAAGSLSASLHDVPRTVPGAHMRVNCPWRHHFLAWGCALSRPSPPPWLLTLRFGKWLKSFSKSQAGAGSGCPRRKPGGLGVPQASCLHMGPGSQGGKEAGALGRGQALRPQDLPPHKPRVRLAPGKEAGQATGPRGEGRSCPGRGRDLSHVVCKAFLRAGEALPGGFGFFFMFVCISLE